MSACSRCFCESPNPECVVCWKEPDEEPEPEAYDDYPDPVDEYVERMLDRADVARDERRDAVIC
jgi:hypothetical protein